MSEGFFGQRGLTAGGNDANAVEFLVRQIMAQARTVVPVKVIAVHGGGVDRPPTIDVQPLINQTNGIGESKPHGVVYGIATTRSQGGTGGIINDPRVGDVGLMSVADRDISSLKANDGAQSNPGSYRTHDLSDGVYHGSMLMVPPVHYLHFTDEGIVISTPGSVTINGVTIDASGNIVAPGHITSMQGDITLSTHLHGGGPPPDPGT